MSFCSVQFFRLYDRLLGSNNYVTRRQSLKVSGSAPRVLLCFVRLAPACDHNLCFRQERTLIVYDEAFTPRRVST